MDQYPTEEEEFELMYQDEMDLMDEMQEVNIMTPQPCTSKSVKNKENTANKSILQTPQFSQIPYNSTSEQEQNQCESNHPAVNRRLFDASKDTPSKRISSTPLERNSNEQQKENELRCFEEIQQTGLNRKRRLKGMFDDIYSDGFEDFNTENAAKKSKNEEQRDLELIEKILKVRKMYKESINPLMKDNASRLDALHDFKKRNLSSEVPKYPFIPVVRSNDERIYVRYHSEQFEKKQIDEINFRGNFLGELKEEIWNQAREMVLKRMTNQNNLISKTTTDDVVEVPIDVNLNESKLWVEKYKPRKYIDLLSDETTNRSLLSWLKMWDKLVFGKEFKTKETKTQKFNTFNKKTKRFEKLNTDCDTYGRPMQKIALLCGPPGLGKTTLAHTIARHAGYNVREMNASDDRNPDAFRLALENGTQMSSVLNEEKRPNCIILDEIDGAPQQSIDFLIKFVTDNVVTKVKKGNKAQKHILRRPVICICNDMYVPALRQLRQIAFVVNFPPIESSRLAERLLYISHREHFKTDLRTLIALVEKSGNDIRTCISVMQFFNSKKKTLTLEDVFNSDVGQKDRHQGLFEVWTAIFHIQKQQKQIIKTNINHNKHHFLAMTDVSTSVRFDNILQIIHTAGDYERLMQGVYENYLSQKLPFSNMKGIIEATQWFCFSDAIQNTINNLQNYVLYPYLNFGFVAWHFLFASLVRPKINFPNKGYEFNQKLKTQKMIFQSFQRGITTGQIGIGQGHVILMETVPLLKRILSPNLRSLSLQLLNPKERSDLVHTVNVMVDLGLTFIQVKSADGLYQYQIEPDLELLFQFPGFQGITINYFARQLVALEVELEKMRRSAPKLVKNSQTPGINAKKQFEEMLKSKTKNQEKNLPNHLQSLKPKILHNSKIKETVSKDFFGRVVTKQFAITTQEDGTDIVVKSPIWYRYKEGFNNAVRKDVLMSQLL